MKELAKAKPSTRKLLTTEFYRRPTLTVARELLGKILVVTSDQGVTSGRIVETEAYMANDPASHSFKGKTPRASIMFGSPGVAYVYFIYGMYEMLNFVTEPEGDAGAVLIRAVEPIDGLELMKRRRACKRPLDLTNGPGKLCNAMRIQMAHNGASLQGPEIQVFDDGFAAREIAVSPRVGIQVAKEKLWRFYLPENLFVSRVPQNLGSHREAA